MWNNKRKYALIVFVAFCICFFLLFPYFKPIFNKRIEEKLTIKSFDELKRYDVPTYIDAPTVGNILMVRKVETTEISYIYLYGKFDVNKLDSFLDRHKFKKMDIDFWLFKEPPVEVMDMFKKDTKDYFMLKGNEVSVFDDYEFKKTAIRLIVSDEGSFVCKIIHPYKPRK